MSPLSDRATRSRPVPRRGPSRRSWRVTTACRVFGLALACGQALSLDTLGPSSPALVALTLLALISCVLEFDPTGPGSAWIPVVEALLAATLLAGVLPSHALYVYLAVPAVVAGISQGWVTALNATLAGALAFFTASLTIQDLLKEPEGLGAASLWLLVGLGAGLLAGWQTRSLRRLEDRQGPYAAAHRLVAQLSNLTRATGVGLDSLGAAREVEAQLRGLTATPRATVYLRTPTDSWEVLCATDPVDTFDALAQGLSGQTARCAATTAVVPLRVGEHHFGAVVLDRDAAWSSADLVEVQAAADELAIRLETALLFDDVRTRATSEERNRLARDIHDGVAQEIVALSYLVDDIISTSAEPDTLRTAGVLREEITRVVAELRLSIFDLRHEVADQSLSGALAEYVREIGAESGLRVHLVLDEQGPPLPHRLEGELLRIAQEAISNVRRHAAAGSLWVTLTTDGASVRLEVADDGIGSATPRDRHYGLHTMRERAERVGADLAVREREGGGTVVALISRHDPRSGTGVGHDHYSPAGR